MSRHDREQDAAGAVRTVKGRIGPALAEEHGARPPSPRIGPKLWLIAALALLVAVSVSTGVLPL